MARIRDAERNAAVPGLARAVFGAPVAFVAVPAATFAALAPDRFPLAFGPSRTDAGEFDRHLAPSACAAVVAAHLPSLVVLAAPPAGPGAAAILGLSVIAAHAVLAIRRERGRAPDAGPGDESRAS